MDILFLIDLGDKLLCHVRQARITPSGAIESLLCDDAAVGINLH
jgi:hypothetical protein